MIFYEEKERFYDDLESLREGLQDSDSMPDDFMIEVVHCTLESITVIDEDSIIEWAEKHCEDRDDEEGNHQDKVAQILCEHINFDAINEAMPKLWYPNGKIETIDLRTI